MESQLVQEAQKDAVLEFWSKNMNINTNTSQRIESINQNKTVAQLFKSNVDSTNYATA